MARPRPLARGLLLAALFPALSSCGAGIAGIVAGSSSGGGSSPPAGTPTLALANPSAPLVGTGLPARLALVNNLQIPSSASVRLELRALGAVDEQRNPVVVSVDPDSNSSSLAFLENHVEIFKRVSDPTSADVAATMQLFVDDQPVGRPVPFTLIRQRTATLEPAAPAGQPYTVSAKGGSMLRLRVTGRPNEHALTGVRLEVGVPGSGVLLATGVETKRIPGSLDWEVSGFTPPSAQPTQAFPRIADDLAGISTVVPQVYFRPAIQAVSPGFGSTDGGTLVALFGQGLAPLTNPDDLGSAPIFSRVKIELERGGRRLAVPPVQLREAQSSLNQLVFTVPPTPDGKPGDARLSVTVDLIAVKVADTVDDLFVYRRPAPGFGPRGALLTDVPLGVGTGTVRGEAGDAPDLVLLSSTGGVPRVELLAAEQNGMFSTFGPPMVAGQQLNPAQVDPQGACTGDFDGDGDTDVVVINAGTGSRATHSWLVREAEPLPLMGLSPVAVNDVLSGGDAVGVPGDFDGDGATDVVVLPTLATATPRIVLARPAGGRPVFSVRPLNGALSQHGPFEVGAAADLDGDGFLDLVGFTGRDAMRAVVAYGDGSGGFGQQLDMQVTIPGYSADPGSAAVGLHVLELGPPRPIALVLAGLDFSALTPGTVALLMPAGQPRAYRQPDTAEVLTFQGTKALVATACGELDGGPPGELVLAGAFGSSPEMRLLRWSGGSLTEVPNAFSGSLEPLENIRSLSIGLAVPDDGVRITSPIRGVFVDHTHQPASGAEDRISTWLVGPGPTIVPPDASLAYPDPILGAALGNFSGQPEAPNDPDQEARDLCVATAASLVLYTNHGVGDFTAPRELPQGGIVPGTLRAIDVGSGRANAVAFLASDGRLGFLDPGQPATVLTQRDLRSYASAFAADWDVAPTSSILSGDVDGDGLADLAVVLVLKDSSAGGHETVLLLLRGKSAAAAAELPFHLPDGPGQAERIGFEGTAAVLGDFTAGTITAPELAVAFPVGINHVRFYRYLPGTPSPTDDRFAWSVAHSGRPGLIAGDEPAQLIAADFDGNATVDLAVASGGDSKVRVFLNLGTPDPKAPEEVNIAAFLESPGAPPLPPGVPSAMLAGDFDGDDVRDVLVVTLEITTATLKEKSQHVAVYLSSGTGTLSMLRVLAPFRTGNEITRVGLPALRDADAYPALADVNWDGVPDLVLGWSKLGPSGRNIRVLFAGAR